MRTMPVMILIVPTIPVQRTIRGVDAGRDEVLERGIEAVSKP